MSYEEVFIPEPIKEPNLRLVLLPDDMKNDKPSGESGKIVHMPDAGKNPPDTDAVNEAPLAGTGKIAQMADSGASLPLAGEDDLLPADDVVCVCDGLEGKVYIKNYLRLILQCDSTNRLLYLDLFEKRHKLYDVYDRYGRVRKGVTAKISPEYRVYRLTDVKNGKTCIVKLQDIKCNKAKEPLGFLYSLWESPGSTEPFFVGVTY